MTTVTDEILGKIARQQHDLFRRVREGALDPEAISRGLQRLIEGKPPAVSWNPPIWWRTPWQQVERARQLWPNIVVPEPPTSFVPRTTTEVLLLHVPDTFDNLWDKVEAPAGFGTYRWDGVKTDKRHLCLAPNKREYTEPVWLAFDPEYGKGQRPDELWGQENLAASEVLSALIQFPDWSLSWFGGASAPNLSGYQLKWEADWSSVPCLNRWVSDRQLLLRAGWAGRRYDGWASPSVREC